MIFHPSLLVLYRRLAVPGGFSCFIGPIADAKIHAVRRRTGR